MSDSAQGQLDERVAHEQLRSISEQTGRVVLSLVLMECFLIWLLSQADLLWQAVLWAAACAVLQSWHWTIPQRYIRRGGSAVAGVAMLARWSSIYGWTRASIMIPLFMHPVGDVHYIFTMVMVGQLAGAVASSPGLFWGYLCLGVPITLTAATAWALQATVDGAAVAGLLLLLFGVLAAHVKANGVTLGKLVRLAQEKEELAASLQAERDRAQAASQSKTRFFAAASHDLRQPLHALSINATSLELVARRQNDPTIKQLSQSISRALHASNDLLQGLLDISRLDSGAVSVELRPVDAVAMLHNVADQFRASAAQRGIDLKLDVGQTPADGGLPLLISTDHDLMLRVLNNLVSNALKFTRKGHVLLSVRRAANGADGLGRVVFGVRDTGCGIPASEQEKVFEEFYQVDNPSRDRSQGLGLGLSIVQRSVALLGGSLVLRSIPGEGTEVEIELAVALGGTDEAPVANPALEDQAPSYRIIAKVLAIDDEPEILASLQGFLPLLGCELRCAQSLADAQALLDAGFLPEILLVDYRLRGASGIDAIKSLQNRLGPIPALLITGDAAPAGLQGEPGNEWVLVHKPIDGARLAEHITLALSKPRDPSPP